MSLYGAWPIDPSSACVTAINTLISELSGQRKCLERKPFSCSITLRALSRCPTLVLAELSLSSGSVSRCTRDFRAKQITWFYICRRLREMDDGHAHSVADCGCNGVSGGSWSVPDRCIHTHTHKHMLLPSTVHTYKNACIVGVLVQRQTLTNCGIHLHAVMYMWNAYKLKTHRHVDASIHKHISCDCTYNGFWKIHFNV